MYVRVLVRMNFCSIFLFYYVRNYYRGALIFLRRTFKKKDEKLQTFRLVVFRKGSRDGGNSKR